MLPVVANPTLFGWLLTLRSTGGDHDYAATALMWPCMVSGVGLSPIRGGSALAKIVSGFAPFWRRYFHDRKDARP